MEQLVLKGCGCDAHLSSANLHHTPIHMAALEGDVALVHYPGEARAQFMNNDQGGTPLGCIKASKAPDSANDSRLLGKWPANPEFFRPLCLQQMSSLQRYRCRSRSLNSQCKLTAWNGVELACMLRSCKNICRLQGSSWAVSFGGPLVIECMAGTVCCPIHCITYPWRPLGVFPAQCSCRRPRLAGATPHQPLPLSIRVFVWHMDGGHCTPNWTILGFGAVHHRPSDSPNLQQSNKFHPQPQITSNPPTSTPTKKWNHKIHASTNWG